MRTRAFTKRALETFPESLVPEGDWRVIRHYEDPDFGIGGVDDQCRLVVFGDDGWIVGYHLENASVERNHYGPRIDAEYDSLADQTGPNEYMLDRDVSDWIWVNPRFEWLVER